MTTSTSDNPLLSEDFLPAFDRIAPEHVVPGIGALLAEASERLEELARPKPGGGTYDSTLGALERVTERLERAAAVVDHLEGVSTSQELRDAWNEMQPKVSEFASKIPLDERIYAVIKAFASTDEASKLTGARQRFLKKTLDDFRRSGAELDAPGKKRLAEIEVELSKLTMRYSQNVLDATNAFELVLEDDRRLGGLPESAIAAARASAEQKGIKGYRFTLQAPSYIAVMTYADDAKLRETMFRASNTRASSGDHDNRGLMTAILRLRREKATLLGYASFADLVLEDRMAKSGERARKFLQDLREKAEAAFERETNDLFAFRRSLEGANAPVLEAWDVSYYAEKLRRARFDFDDEELRPYFSADRVLEGIFAIASKLYGVRIERTAAAAWEGEKIRAYSISEADGSLSSLFYVDLYPRESKRDGAWMHGISTAPYDGGFVGKTAARSRHLEIVAANLTSAIGDRPALLTHREVETLFHELGHLLHHASSRVPVQSLGGTAVAWDFVELPSQIMENWCWEREALDLFARHVDTGDPIPQQMLARMRAARSFRAATAMMRQIGFAEVDLALHVDWDTSEEQRDGDVVSFARRVFGLFSPVALPADYAMIASFSHIFGSPVGYAAGYYSYKWAEVLDADAFARFKEEGIFSRTVGMSFRNEILARGDSEDPQELYRRFRGREPALDALLERDGLLAPASTSSGP